MMRTLIAAAVVFGAAILTLTVMADVVTQQATTVVDAENVTSAYHNVTNNGLAGLTNMSLQLPTLGSIVIAVVILMALAGFIALMARYR